MMDIVMVMYGSVKLVKRKFLKTFFTQTELSTAREFNFIIFFIKCDVHPKA